MCSFHFFNGLLGRLGRLSLFGRFVVFSRSPGAATSFSSGALTAVMLPEPPVNLGHLLEFGPVDFAVLVPVEVIEDAVEHLAPVR